MLSFPVALYGLAFGQGWFAGWLASPSMVFWGEVSFSLYMTHAPVQRIIDKIIGPNRLEAMPLLLRLGGLALIAVAIAYSAVLTFQLIEEPTRKRMARMFK